MDGYIYRQNYKYNKMDYYTERKMNGKIIVIILIKTVFFHHDATSVSE